MHKALLQVEALDKERYEIIREEKGPDSVGHDMQ